MNIFVLDLDPVICAKSHCDQHVRKMILEYTAILSYSYYLNKVEPPVFGPIRYMNYSVSKWGRQTMGNYAWLAELLENLAKEFEYRFEKKHMYDREGYVSFFRQNKPDHVSRLEMTEFVLTMPEEYKTKDAVESYKNYYVHDKSKFAKWTRRKPPEWYCYDVAVKSNIVY